MCYSFSSLLLDNYILQPIFSSDDVVMSRKNRNFHLLNTYV